MGRNSQNKVVIFPKDDQPYVKGDYAWVRVEECTQATLKGKILVGDPYSLSTPATVETN
jgi:tRNA-2-methylthio-N6-dimethylallyladenosine synthase